MSKPRSRPRHRPAAIAATLPATTDGLGRTLSRTPAGWTNYATRLQEETIHLAGTCLGRCIEAAARFAHCRSLADVVDAQSQLVGDLLVEFVDEGAILVSAFCEPWPDPCTPPSAIGTAS